MRTLIRPGAFQVSVREPATRTTHSVLAAATDAPAGFGQERAHASSVSSASPGVANEQASRTEVRTLCAWCSVVMVDGPPAPVSHGCCPVCFDRVIADAS